MAEEKTEARKQVVLMTMTKDQLDDLWFKTFQMRMGPPEEDGYYRLELELETE